MMYVMCYFQVLPHADIVIEDVPSLAAASDKSSTITGATKPNVPSQVCYTDRDAYVPFLLSEND